MPELFAEHNFFGSFSTACNNLFTNNLLSLSNSLQVIRLSVAFISIRLCSAFRLRIAIVYEINLSRSIPKPVVSSIEPSVSSFVVSQITCKLVSSVSLSSLSPAVCNPSSAATTSSSRVSFALTISSSICGASSTTTGCSFSHTAFTLRTFPTIRENCSNSINLTYSSVLLKLYTGRRCPSFNCFLYLLDFTTS